MKIKRTEMMAAAPKDVTVTYGVDKTLETRIEELERINAIMQREIADLTGWLGSHDKRFRAMSEAAFKLGRLG